MKSEADEGAGAGQDIDTGYILVNINKFKWCSSAIVGLL
jgi:hypothetical protein